MEKSVDTRFFARPSDRMYANILRSMNPRQKPAYRRIESVSVIHRHLAAGQSKRQIYVRHRSSLFSRPQPYNTPVTRKVIASNYF